MSADSPKNNQPDPISSDESLQQVHAELVESKVEPKEGHSMMPLFLLGILSAVIFVGSIYFIHYRGGFSPLVYDERFDPKAAAAKQVAAVDPIAAGRRLYNGGGSCVSCHGPQGAGVPGVYPPLAGAEWVVGSEERLIRILLHGLNGEIQVKGNTYNGVMPAFGVGSGFNWNDERVAHVLTYIRQEWGNNAAPIDPAKVTEIRTQGAPGRTKPWSQTELMAVP